MNNGNLLPIYLSLKCYSTLIEVLLPSGTSYYVDSPNTMNTDVEEGMYDSLDRRHNNVTMTTSAQYEEPDKDMGANRPLILPGNQSDDQYYLGKEGGVRREGENRSVSSRGKVITKRREHIRGRITH